MARTGRPGGREMPWMHERRRGVDAPRDGSRFKGVAKGSVELEVFVWDREMGCFLSTGFGAVDAIGCWWPLAPGEDFDPGARAREEAA